RLIETDMPCPANAQQLKVQSACGFYLRFVCFAILLQLVWRDRAIRNMDIFRFDVHMIEQMLVHEIMIALDIVPFHRVVFIQIEGDHILETEALLPMHADELLIYPDRGRTCRKTKYTSLSFFRFPSDQCRNFLGH